MPSKRVLMDISRNVPYTTPRGEGPPGDEPDPTKRAPESVGTLRDPHFVTPWVLLPTAACTRVSGRMANDTVEGRRSTPMAMYTRVSGRMANVTGEGR